MHILGCDVAASSNETSDYSALCVWDATANKQKAEMRKRIPVLRDYAYFIKELVLYMIDTLYIKEENIKLVIERNSFGLGVIEYLLYDEEHGDLFNRIMYYYEYKKDDWVPGIQTNAKTRPLIINSFVQQVNEHPDSIKGIILQSETRDLIQKSSGRIEADRGKHDDLIMATAFALYVRKLMIKSGELQVKGEGNFGPPIDITTLLSHVNINRDAREDKQNSRNAIEVCYESDMKKKEKPAIEQIIDSVL
jgi:hypothetical protein